MCTAAWRAGWPRSRVLLLAGFLALYYALAAGPVRRGGPGRPAATRRCSPAVAGLAELLRGTLFTGFPWGASGYAHVDGPLAGCAGSASTASARRRRPGCALRGCRCGARARGLALLAARRLGPPGRWRLQRCSRRDSRRPAAAARGAAAGQHPAGREVRGGTGVPLALDWYGRSCGRRAQLVVAPETVIPLLPAAARRLPGGAARHLSRQRRAAALSAFRWAASKLGYTNSVLGVSPHRRRATATTSTTWCRSASSSRRLSSGSRG